MFEELKSLGRRKAELARDCSRQRALLDTEFRNLAEQIDWMDRAYHTARSFWPKLKIAAPLIGLLVATRWGDAFRSSGWLAKFALAVKIGRKGYSFWRGLRSGWSRQAV